MYSTYAIATHVFYYSLRNMYCTVINAMMPIGAAVLFLPVNTCNTFVCTT